MICPKCSSGEMFCPECGCMYPHGSVIQCRTKSCQGLGVPLECVECHSIVHVEGDDVEGVLSEEKVLIPYVGSGEFLCPICRDAGQLSGRDTVHPLSERKVLPDTNKGYAGQGVCVECFEHEKATDQ